MMVLNLSHSLGILKWIKFFKYYFDNCNILAVNNKWYITFQTKRKLNVFNCAVYIFSQYLLYYWKLWDLNRSQLKSISSKTKHYLIYFIIIIIVIVLSNTILNSINDLNNDNTFFYFITKAIIIYRLDINHILYYNQLNRFPNKLK